MLNRKLSVILMFFVFLNSYSQTDIDKILKGGEIIVNGLSFLKKDKSEVKETKIKEILYGLNEFD